MTSDMGIMPLRDFSVDGTEFTFIGDRPDVSVFFILEFDGESFTGEWDAEGMVGFISGTRR
jgi:hypothetical protein